MHIGTTPSLEDACQNAQNGQGNYFRANDYDYCYLALSATPTEAAKQCQNMNGFLAEPKTSTLQQDMFDNMPYKSKVNVNSLTIFLD